MMDKRQFEERLEEIKINHPDWRPFLCSGYPLDADVFIVGLNPATPGLTNWWKFWHPATGLDLEDLERENMKFRQGSSSRTRRRINSLQEGLGDNIRCVETNLYPIASSKLSSMPSIGKTTNHLNLLLEACSPKVIYVHGSEPSNYIARKMGLSLPSIPRGEYVGPFESLRVSFPGACTDSGFGILGSFRRRDSVRSGFQADLPADTPELAPAERHWVQQKATMYFAWQAAFGPTHDGLRALGTHIRQNFLK